MESESGTPTPGDPAAAPLPAAPRAEAVPDLASCRRCRAPVPPGGRFCSFCGTAVAAADAPDPIERRPLVVLFCDLVGSSRLSRLLDPEDLADLLAAFHERIADTVARFGGMVARRLGDGALACFGYPVAEEDDAERALLGALAVVEAVATMPSPLDEPLAVRIGAASGVAVIGEAGGEGLRDGFDMQGDVPGLAAGLQMLAQPGSVLVADGLRALLPNLFTWRDLGPQRLDGRAEPLRVWQLLAPSGVIGRFEGRQHAAPLPLLGRDAPLDRLLALWTQARDGAGAMVLVTGEAGIGKSRLVVELLDRMVADQHARMRYFCSPFHRDTPLHPFVQYLEGYLGIAEADAPPVRADKVRSALGMAPPDDLALIGTVLDAPLPGGEAVARLAPALRQDRLLDAMFALTERRARTQPVLAVVEDVHWADPTSVDLLARGAARCAGLHLLIILTARPDFAPPWLETAGVTRIELGPLDADRSAELVRLAAGPGRVLPQAVVTEIVGRADGVPLFVEELARAVGEEDPAAGRVAVVPATIQASLRARLDRLGPVRDLALAAAAIGRDFDLDLLGEVAGLDDAALGAAVARLLDHKLVQDAPSAPGQYRFRHALIREAAYQAILRPRRRALHRRIATALARRQAGVAASAAPLVAHHFAEAGDAAEAARWWRRAGESALAQSSPREAQAQLERGLALVATLPQDAERQRLELDLRLPHLTCLFATIGWAAETTAEAFARARALCDAIGTPPQARQVLFGQWTRAFTGAELDVALAGGEDMLARAVAQDDPEWRLLGQYCTGPVLFSLGHFADSAARLREAIDLYDPARRNAYAGTVLIDPGVMMQSYLGWSLWCLGEYAEARRIGRAMLDRARATAEPVTLAIALFRESWIVGFAESPAASLPLVAELEALSGEQSLPYWRGLAAIQRGWCLGQMGDPAAGLDWLRRGLEAFRRTRSLTFLPSFMRMEAELLHLGGDAVAATALLDEADALRQRTQEVWDAPEHQRLRGQIRLAQGDRVGAAAAFRAALAAAGPGRPWFGLRAALSLADLVDARTATDLLAPYAAAPDPDAAAADLAAARARLRVLAGDAAAAVAAG